MRGREERTQTLVLVYAPTQVVLLTLEALLPCRNC